MEWKLSPGLKRVVREMQDLNSLNPKRIEWDFECMFPVLNGLGGACSGQRSWFSYFKAVDTSHHELKILMPLMHCCLQLLHNADGFLSRDAFKALNTLIVVASEQQESDILWQRLIETSMIACIRIDLQTLSLVVRRTFILLLSTVAKSFASVNSPNLCSDLFTLGRDNEPELDFFLNITHVQIHRRARALGRLQNIFDYENSFLGSKKWTSAPFQHKALSICCNHLLYILSTSVIRMAKKLMRWLETPITMKILLTVTTKIRFFLKWANQILRKGK